MNTAAMELHTPVTALSVIVGARDCAAICVVVCDDNLLVAAELVAMAATGTVGVVAAVPTADPAATPLIMSVYLGELALHA